jgi:glycolate oxidase FAD binding subunit
MSNSEAIPPALRLFSEQIRAAGVDGKALAVGGGGTKAFYGNGLRAADAQALCLSAWRGIVSYEPSELVVVAKAGTPLVELEAALAERGQMLGFEPPHFGHQATIGGCVAAGLSGPRRMASGAVRDFVLGIEMLDGRGQLLRFGGQVMKNVAGYDIARLLAGSLGALGVLTEVSLKVLPRPLAQTTLALPMGQAQALAAFDQWAAQPLPISAAAWVDETAWIRLSGARAAVEGAVRALGKGVAPVEPALADGFWTSLREQTHPFFTLPSASASPSSPALWRLALPARCAPLAPPQEAGVAPATLIEWGGAQRWLQGGVEGAALRAWVAGLGGHATRFRSHYASADAVFSPLSGPLLTIHRRLKKAFDPHALFNPGRLHPEL